MLKDMLADLQESAARIKARRASAEEALSAAMLPSSAGGITTGGGRKTAPVKGPSGKANGKLDALFKAIQQQESGGDYGVVNGIGAMGAYQIMPSNIEGPGGWDKEVLGRNVSTKQFLNNPRLQDKIAKGKLAEYFKQYGAAGAAKAWYAGPGNAKTNSNSAQSGGPSINGYAADVLKIMRGYLK